MIRSFVLWLLHFIPHTVIVREEGVPYMTRYYLLGGPRDANSRYSKAYFSLAHWFKWNIFLHCFHSSDEPVPHNHPWPGTSIILRGSYLEWRPSGNGCFDGRTLRPGDVNHLEPETFHWVELMTPKVWTLFFAGQRIQDWGFQTPEGFIPWRKYKVRRPGATWSSERAA